MNFHVGQKVVCIKSHSQGVVKEGITYTIKGIRINCKCSSFVFDVGIVSSRTGGFCLSCGSVTPLQHGIWWISNTLFAPLDTMKASEKAADELIKELKIELIEK